MSPFLQLQPDNIQAEGGSLGQVSDVDYLEMMCSVGDHVYWKSHVHDEIHQLDDIVAPCTENLPAWIRKGHEGTYTVIKTGYTEIHEKVVFKQIIFSKILYSSLRTIFASFQIICLQRYVVQTVLASGL